MSQQFISWISVRIANIGIPKLHSLTVVNDIILALDTGNITLLSLLDLSSACDTVDHEIINRLNFFRISVNSTWMISYLSRRSQSIRFGGNISRDEAVRYGVPRGSVLYWVIPVYFKHIADVENYSFIWSIGSSVCGRTDYDWMLVKHLCVKLNTCCSLGLQHVENSNWS